MSELDSIASTEIVSVIDGIPTTTTLVVASKTDNQHDSVMKIVRDYQGDFEEFGILRFEIGKLNEGRGRPATWAVLNEEQAGLLVTYLRNNEKVRAFKKAMIREFSRMRQALAARPSINGADITRLELIQIAHNAETERIALEAVNKELAPKAEAYDTFIDATGKYSVGAVAKMLGTSQNKLFRDLRNAEVFIAKGSMRNTPYQQFMRHFEVLPHEFQHNSGETGCSYTTYVQPSGIDFIRRKLGLLSIDPQPPLLPNGGDAA